MIFSTLNNLKKGGTASIYRLEMKGEMRRRLLELGFIPGTAIECLFCSAKNAISAYLIRESVIALRYEDAKQILIIPRGVRI